MYQDEFLRFVSRNVLRTRVPPACDGALRRMQKVGTVEVERRLRRIFRDNHIQRCRPCDLYQNSHRISDSTTMRVRRRGSAALFDIGPIRRYLAGQIPGKVFGRSRGLTGRRSASLRARRFRIVNAHRSQANRSSHRSRAGQISGSANFRARMTEGLSMMQPQMHSRRS